MNHAANRKSVLFIVFSYMVIAGLWIAFSDRLLSMLSTDPSVLIRWFILKGLFFVLVTGLMLYGLISRMVARLHKTINERDSLLRELNHRVNNNLQLISNLASLQRRRLTDKRTQVLMDDVRNRIRSIAMVQEKAFLKKGTSRIKMKEYITDLANSVFRDYNAQKCGVRLETHIDNISMEIERAISIGLIINEVVTNSLKYAFQCGPGGEVSIGLRGSGDNLVELSMCDNGKGLPVDFNPRAASTLGMQLIYGLAETQLNGQVSLERDGGTAYRMVFKKD